MPRRPKRPCNYPGCPELIESRERYCPNHKKVKGEQFREPRKDTPENRFYDSVAWQRLRRLKLNQDPLCEQCLSRGVTKAAYMVHHKVPIKGGGEWLPPIEGLESLCLPCHNKTSHH